MIYIIFYKYIIPSSHIYLHMQGHVKEPTLFQGDTAIFALLFIH